MRAIILAALLLCVSSAPSGKNHVTPDFLDQLLSEKRYEEFEHYLNIPVANLSRPNGKKPAKHDLMFTKGLFEGDVVLPQNSPEEGRQGIRFDRYGGNRWPNARGQPSYIPVVFSSDFSQNDRITINNALAGYNGRVNRVKFVYYSDQQDYIYIFPGNGCWSYIGRIGGGQGLSLGNGCVWRGTVMHEAHHAVGFGHEQSRSDRDDYVEILWHNIPEHWHSQYQKQDPEVFGLQDRYDYYSIMHYGIYAPETGKRAFNIKQNGIDESRIGNGNELTDIDANRVEILYS